MRVLFLALFALAVLRVPNLYRKCFHTFHEGKIALEYPANRAWDLELSETERSRIQSILNQPFYYLGKGLQTYAFASQDGQYVVKLFRIDDCKMPLGQSFLKSWKDRIGLKSKKKLPLQERLERVFDASVLSYRKLGAETGIVWASLNPKAGEWPTLLVRDRFHRWHSIDTGRTRFLLQKRAELIEPTLLKAYAEDRPRFLRLVRSYRQLLSSLKAKGIYNRDPKVGSNFGFIGDEAVQIDFGSVSENPQDAKYDPTHYAARFRGFLECYCPDGLAAYGDGL